MDVLNKELPHDNTAEEGVLGCMMLGEDAISVAEEILKPSDFYFEIYGQIYKTILEMHNNQIDIDPITLSVRLGEKNIPEEYRSLSFLKGTFGAITSANIKQYANIVKEKSLRRGLIKSLADNLAKCYSDEENPVELIDTVEQEIIDLASITEEGEFVRLDGAYNEVEHHAHEAASGNEDVIGIKTGISDLDNVLVAFEKGMDVIAGRPRMGKTAFALNLALNVASQGKTVAIISLEMDKVSLARRLLSMQSHISGTNLYTGTMEEQDWKDFEIAKKELIELGIYVDDIPSVTVTKLRSKLRKAKNVIHADMIILDYLSLVISDGIKTDSRQQEVSEISRAIRETSKALQIPIITIAQLSRDCEKRGDKRPMLSDLRESGSIEQDATQILFVHREEIYKERDDNKGIAEIIVAKNRNFGTGTAKLKWIAEQTRFSNLEYSSNDEPKPKKKEKNMGFMDYDGEIPFK